MRVLILITLLCNMAFSALYLNGAEYTQVVTINHLQVAETTSDFLFQKKIPRVGDLITAVESADDVAFTNINDTTRRARWVIYTPDTIFLYAHIAVSSTADTSYRLQFGKALNETNASATFTNCGITNFWGFDEGSGSSANDYAGAKNITSLNNLNFGNSYFKSGIISNSVGGNTTTESDLEYSNASKMVMSFILKRSNIGSLQVSIGYRTTSVQNTCITFLVSNQIQIQSASGGGTFTTTQAFTNTTDYILYTLIYDGSLTNTDRYKLYVNGSIVGGSVSGTIPTAMPVTTYPMLVGYTSPYSTRGNYDNILIGSNIYTYNYELTRYNMLFSPALFSTLGTIDATAITFNPQIDTLRLVCSAENALTYQWYDNNVAVSGATDSVYTIYADSTFYSIKHVIYCLVNGSVKSVEWKFQFPGIINRKITIGPNLKIY